VSEASLELVRDFIAAGQRQDWSERQCSRLLERDAAPVPVQEHDD